MIRYIRTLLRIVATAPEKTMSAKMRPSPIRPYRDKGTIGTKMVTIIRNARKKLNPRSSTQKGKSETSLDFGVDAHAGVLWFSSKMSSHIVHVPHGRRPSTASMVAASSV
jgi:hypothetical protein